MITLSNRHRTCRMLRFGEHAGDEGLRDVCMTEVPPEGAELQRLQRRGEAPTKIDAMMKATKKTAMANARCQILTGVTSSLPPATGEAPMQRCEVWRQQVLLRNTVAIVRYP